MITRKCLQEMLYGCFNTLIPLNFELLYSWVINPQTYVVQYNWRPLSLSELTLIIFHMELTHLDLEASN